MDGPKRSQLRVRLRVTARRRGADGDGAGGAVGPGGRKRRMEAPVLNSAAKLQRREIGGRQLAARGGGPAAAVPERFRNMQLQVRSGAANVCALAVPPGWGVSGVSGEGGRSS
jgi:hypothetical protein